MTHDPDAGRCLCAKCREAIERAEHHARERELAELYKRAEALEAFVRVAVDTDHTNPLEGDEWTAARDRYDDALRAVRPLIGLCTHCPGTPGCHAFSCPVGRGKQLRLDAREVAGGFKITTPLPDEDVQAGGLGMSLEEARARYGKPESERVQALEAEVARLEKSVARWEAREINRASCCVDFDFFARAVLVLAETDTEEVRAIYSEAKRVALAHLGATHSLEELLARCPLPEDKP